MLDALGKTVEHPAIGQRVVTVEEVARPQPGSRERAAVIT
jgi:hypothetical protein